MSASTELIEVEVKRGYWLYDETVRKTVMVFRLNYDFYYEEEKDSFFDLSTGIPVLNKDGHSYLVVWPEENFIFPPGESSVPIGRQASSLKGAVEFAEQIIQQPIEWIT